MPNEKELELWASVAQQYDAELQRFPQVASNFVEFIDDESWELNGATLETIELLLIDILAASRRLPATGESSPDEGDDEEEDDEEEEQQFRDAVASLQARLESISRREPPTNEERQKLDGFFARMHRLEGVIGEYDILDEVFDPYSRLERVSSSSSAEPPHISPNTLSNALATIYDELNVGLNHWQAATVESVRNAGWHWRYHTDDISIGEELTGSIKAIHHLRFQYDNLWDGSEDEDDTKRGVEAAP